MDAHKITASKGNAKYDISDAQAIRTALANELRDLADDIEIGARAITELQTFESAQSLVTTSIMHLVTQQRRTEPKENQ